MQPLFNNASETFKRLNPHLFSSVGQLPSAESKQDTGQTLDREHEGRKTRKIRVSIIVCRHRLITDRDNLIGGCKHLRDAIAANLGTDDRDDNISWEYHQIKTDGQQGAIVKIEL